jgi:hypothetical protein
VSISAATRQREFFQNRLLCGNEGVAVPLARNYSMAEGLNPFRLPASYVRFP